jgi:hypothetical protein
MPLHPLAALAGAGLALLACAAQAGTITSSSTLSLPGASTGSLGPLGATPAPNNDNSAGPSPNSVPASIFFNSPGGMEIELVTAASGGSTEYRFVQTFVNNSGAAWTGFVFELGYGLGNAFTLSDPLDGLDFDQPDADPAPTASMFANLVHLSDRIEWSGGSVPSIGVVAFSFSIDLPDIAGNRFTLRQTPVVDVVQPVAEPSSLLLAGAAMLALVSRRRGGGGPKTAPR